MREAFASLTKEQQHAFRSRLARLGFDPDVVIQEGKGELWHNTASIEDFKRWIGNEAPPEKKLSKEAGQATTPPVSRGPQGTANLAEDFVFGNVPATPQEMMFMEQNLGPFAVRVEAHTEIVLDGTNHLVLEGGAQVLEFGKITLKPGGRIIVRDCFAKITCQVLEKTA